MCMSMCARVCRCSIDLCICVLARALVCVNGYATVCVSRMHVRVCVSRYFRIARSENTQISAPSFSLKPTKLGKSEFFLRTESEGGTKPERVRDVYIISIRVNGQFRLFV